MIDVLLLAAAGRQYMLLKKHYSDGFILHDETTNDPLLSEDVEALQAHFGSRFLSRSEDRLQQVTEKQIEHGDTRQDLSELWAKVCEHELFVSSLMSSHAWQNVNFATCLRILANRCT